MFASLGTVITPTGVLVVLDPGYMNMWCHTRPPMMPDGILGSPEETAAANRAADFKIVGPDADRAGVLFDRQAHPLYLFDIPPGADREIEQMFREAISKQGLRAELQRLPARVSHRTRVDLAIERGHGAGELQFHGLWCCAIAGVPTDRPLELLAESMPKGPDEGRLRRVTVSCHPGHVAESIPVGHVMVDAGMLMVADADGLGRWVDGSPMDGLADFTFWGKDAELAAKACAAKRLSDDRFGWCDLPVDETARHARDVMKLTKERAWVFGSDFSPHDHRHQLLAQIDAGPTESGIVTLGNARACGFRSTWGDFIFEVHRDVNAQGRLVAIRMELGTPENVGLMRGFELRSKLAMVTKVISEGKEPVRFAYREEPERERDSGWRMFSGTETEDYTNDSRNVVLVEVSVLLGRDATLKKIIDYPEGCAFERKTAGEDFGSVMDWKPRDD